MITELNEKQFIEAYSEETYHKVVEKAYDHIKDSPEFLNDVPDFFTIQVLPCHRLDGSKFTLIVEATAKKLFGTGMKRIGTDFGIVRILVSDEDMPDEVLDRYNELVKAKKEFSNANVRSEKITS